MYQTLERRKEEKMKSKTAVAILLVAIFAVSSIGTIAIMPARADGTSKTLMMSDAELSSAFAKEWGPATTTITLISPGVEFDFTGLSLTSGTGVGNDYPINSLAGGALYDSSTSYSDFTAYTRYSMLLKNVGSNPVTICLFMNTGFDGNPNHAYCSETVTVGASQSVVLTIDFSSVHNIDWSGSGGGPVLNLNQVSNIGFQVLGSGSGNIIVSALPAPLLYTTPTHIQKAPSDATTHTTFNLQVTLENFANLAGFDIKLTWGNSLITATPIDYTTALNALWGAGDWSAFTYSGTGYYEVVAVAYATSATNTAAQTLFALTFTVAESSNFPLSTAIHFATVKLSDNTTPVPNQIPATVADGMYYMSGAAPDLELTVLKWDKGTSTWITGASYQFLWGNTFEVQVYVTGISANSPLQSYDVKISYDNTLASLVSADFSSGIFSSGTNNYDTLVTNVVHVSGSGTGWSGTSGLLFTLTFEVKFDPTANHIWKYGNTNYLTFQIGIADATLGFGSIGSIGYSGITTPSSITIEVDFIRGDVNCDGVVNFLDFNPIAYYYGQTVPPAASQYDLNADGSIDIYDLVTAATNYGFSAATYYGRADP